MNVKDPIELQKKIDELEYEIKELKLKTDHLEKTVEIYKKAFKARKEQL